MIYYWLINFDHTVSCRKYIYPPAQGTGEKTGEIKIVKKSGFCGFAKRAENRGENRGEFGIVDRGWFLFQVRLKQFVRSSFDRGHRSGLKLTDPVRPTREQFTD